MLNTRTMSSRARGVLASAAALLLALGGAALALPAAASAAQPDFICEGLDSGKIDTVGDPATVEYTAPDGYLVDYYCVKAGTEKFIIQVDPDAKTVIIDHPVKDSVSHYSVKWIAITPPPVDVCANIDGAQATVPAGYSTDGGNCYPPTVDVCPNIPGDQASVPDGMVIDGQGNCGPPPPADVCANIDGVQTTVPVGYTTDGGNCYPPADVCANIDGVQTTVPAGMVADGANCVDKKYWICHAKPADTAANGWNYINVSVNSIIGEHGHTEHSADILPVIPGYLPTGQNLATVYAGGVTGAQLLTDELECTLPTPPDCTTVTVSKTSTYDNDCIADASVSFGEPTCYAYGALVLGDTEHAEFGEPVIEGDEYSVTAYAEEGYHFEDGPGVSDDGGQKVFEGTLPAKITGPACGIVTPTISTTQPTCFAQGTYTLGGTDVQWFKGADPVANGSYPLGSGASVDLTVAPIAPKVFAEGQQAAFHITFASPAVTCDLPTLAMTGSGSDSGLGWAGAITVLLGIAAVVSVRRRATR